VVSTWARLYFKRLPPYSLSLSPLLQCVHGGTASTRTPCPRPFWPTPGNLARAVLSTQGMSTSKGHSRGAQGGLQTGSLIRAGVPGEHLGEYLGGAR